MNNILEIISLPFFQRAAVGGLLIALLTSFMGVQVVLRRASFYPDAIAHASLTGVALGLILAINPLITTVVFAVIVAFALPLMQKSSKIPLDNLLGSLLPSAMALGVLLLALLPGYQPELISFLFGNILTISIVELYWLIGLVTVVLIFLYVYRRQIMLISINEDLAKTSGVKVNKLELIFNVLLAMTVVAALQLVGIILVNALLVMPATIARVYARSLKSMYIITPIVSLFVVLAGLLISANYNIPSGPTIAVLAGLILLVSIFISKLKSTS